jgi:hypothetical protein
LKSGGSRHAIVCNSGCCPFFGNDISVRTNGNTGAVNGGNFGSMSTNDTGQVTNSQRFGPDGNSHGRL